MGAPNLTEEQIERIAEKAVDKVQVTYAGTAPVMKLVTR